MSASIVIRPATDADRTAIERLGHHRPGHGTARRNRSLPVAETFAAGQTGRLRRHDRTIVGWAR